MASQETKKTQEVNRAQAHKVKNATVKTAKTPKAKKTAKPTLSLEEKFKQALVPVEEQPYAVPSNWVWTRLGSACCFGSGGTPSRKNPEYYTGSILWLKTGELNDTYIYDTEEKITDDAVKFSSAKLFPIGTIVIAMYGATIGKLGIVGVPLTTNQACACMISKEQIDNLYLFSYMLQQKNEFIKKGKGGAQPNISQEILKTHVFPLPPIAEQKRIVTRIESLFAKLDQAKEKVQSALESFANRKSAILHQAFTGELTKKWREENGVSLDSWEEKILAQCVSRLGDGLHGTPTYSDHGSHYFINGNNFHKDRIVIKPETKKVSSREFNKYKKCLNDTTVLISINGTLGNTAFYNNEPVILGKSACYFNVLSLMKKEFIRYYLETAEFNVYAHQQATGSTIKNLSLKAMKNLELNLPPLEEQTEIVRILDNLLDKEEQAKQNATSTLDKIELMKQAILARAFRGELGTNNPDDENAVELLKEVLGVE